MTELESALKKIEKLKVENGDLINWLGKFVTIKNMADGKGPLISNQGQALDGFAELANYRGIVTEYLKEKANAHT